MENRMVKVLDDKEQQLNKFWIRTEQLENKFNDLKEAFDEKVNETSQTEEIESQLEQTFANPYLAFKCDFCNFNTKCELECALATKPHGDRK